MSNYDCEFWDRNDWLKKREQRIQEVQLNHTSSSTVAVDLGNCKQIEPDDPFAQLDGGLSSNASRKRPKPPSPIPTKRIKTQIVSEEVQQRIYEEFSHDLNIFEIYHNLRMSKSNKIPLPYALSIAKNRNNNNNAITIDKSKMFSDSDRKSAILSIFSRRSGLGVKSESLHLAVGILDKCLDLLLVTHNVVYDLAVISLILATKQEQVSFLTIKDVVSCGLVKNKTISELCQFERSVFTTLSYRVSFPTPYTFANYLLAILNSSRMKINMTQYLLEIALLSVNSRQYKSEELAHAATCLSFAIGVPRRTSTQSHLESSPIQEIFRIENSLKEFSLINEGSTRHIMKHLLKMYKLALNECHEIYVEYENKNRDMVAICGIDPDLEKFLSKY